MARKLYQDIAKDLGDAVYAHRVAGQDEEIIDMLIRYISSTLQHHHKGNMPYSTERFMDAIQARVNERVDDAADFQ
jgi:hypothetical protein